MTASGADLNKVQKLEGMLLDRKEKHYTMLFAHVPKALKVAMCSHMSC